MPEKKDVLYWLNAILERKYEPDKVIICVDHAKTELKNIQQRILELEAERVCPKDKCEWYDQCAESDPDNSSEVCRRGLPDQYKPKES